MRRLILPLMVAALSSSLAVPEGLAQTAPAGIVTAVHGTATIARASSNQSNPLRFKDDVFLFDRVTTGERSLARILLGGRAVVTARERSILTITAVPGTATLDLESGRLLLAVAKGAMRPGESIDIKTRNAIIGIRGTVVVADFVPGQSRDGSDDATVFTILRGAVEVSQIDPVAATVVGAPLSLGALQSVKVTGLRAPEVNTITAEQAKRLTQGFSMPIRLAPESAKEVADLHANQVERELTGLLGPAPVASAGNDSSRPSRSPNGTGATNSGASNENGGAVSAVTGTVGAVAAPVTGLVSDVAAPVTGVVSAVAAPVTGLVSGVAAPVTGIVSGVAAPVTGVVSGVAAPVSGLVSGVTAPVTGLVSGAPPR
jgi:FecR protein